MIAGHGNVYPKNGERRRYCPWDSRPHEYGRSGGGKLQIEGASGRRMERDVGTAPGIAVHMNTSEAGEGSCESRELVSDGWRGM